MKRLSSLTILTLLALLLSVNSAFAGLTPLKSFVLNNTINAFISQTDKDTVVTVNPDGQVKILNLSNLSMVSNFSVINNPKGRPFRVQSIPNSSYILVEKLNGSIELWNTADGKFVRKISTPENENGWSRYSMRISGDGKHIFIIGGSSKGINVFGLDGGYHRLNLQGDYLNHLFDFFPTSNTGFIISNDMKTLWLEANFVASYDLTDGHLITEFVSTPLVNLPAYRGLFLSPKENILIIPLLRSEDLKTTSGLTFYHTYKIWNDREYEYTRAQLDPKSSYSIEPFDPNYVSVDFDKYSRNLIASDGIGIALFNQFGRRLGIFQTFDVSNFNPPTYFKHLDKIEFFDQGKKVFASVRKRDQNLMNIMIYRVD